MKFWITLIIVLVAGYLWFMPPPVDAIFRDMEFSHGDILYHNVTYETEWGPEVSHAGTVHYIHRAFYSAVPPITHHAIVTTGDFNDHSMTTIQNIDRNGNMSWRAARNPQGTLIVLHFIPRNKEVLEQLKSLKKGDQAVFVGAKERDSKITGSDGKWLQLNHGNHKYILLRTIRIQSK